MGMIVACPNDDTTSLSMMQGTGLNLSFDGQTDEYVALRCPFCRVLQWIQRSVIEWDGSLWRYKI